MTELSNEIVTKLFLAVMPEQKENIIAILKNEFIEFNHVQQISDAEIGALFSRITYSDKHLLCYWVGSFIAWEAYSCLQQNSVIFNQSSKFNHLIDLFRQIKNSDNLHEIVFSQIPSPEDYLNNNCDIEERAVAELACFALSWSFLHEVKHAIYPKETESKTSNELRKIEEFECDLFATNILLENVKEYSKKNNEKLELVLKKRRLGVLFGLFTIVLISENNWEEGEFHPSVKDRLDAIEKNLNFEELNEEMVISWLAFRYLNQVWRDSPMMFEDIAKFG